MLKVFLVSSLLGVNGFLWNLWMDIIGLFIVSGEMIVLRWLLLGRCVLIMGLELFSWWLSGVRMWCRMCSRWVLLVKCWVVCWSWLFCEMCMFLKLLIRMFLMVGLWSRLFSGLKLVSFLIRFLVIICIFFLLIGMCYFWMKFMVCICI